MLATIVLVPEHVFGIEVLPESWDAFLDLGLLFAIGALLVRRPSATGGVLGPVFTRGLLMGLVTAGFVGAAAALVALWHDAGTAVALGAVGLVALSVVPLRAFIGGRADTVLFGADDEPYHLLTALGRSIEAAGTPEEILSEVVDAVAATLGLRYVAIELDVEGTPTVAARAGSPTDPVVRYPLIHAGVPQGWLVVAPPANRRLTGADRRLLADLSSQVGAAAHTAQLMRELRRVNRRTISARADERRRLQRDLHDGLGPLLAGIGLTAEAARNLLTVDPRTADRLLRRIAAESRHATTEVRRLIENLHPLVLDRLGLVAALRAHLAPSDATSAPVTEVRTAGDLGTLPAAVELAAYRILLEAHTNVVRHAHASQCEITIVQDGDLGLRVVDDGIGFPDDGPRGVGIASMTQRAAELGGQCSIASGRDGGTVVEASIPLAPT